MLAAFVSGGPATSAPAATSSFAPTSAGSGSFDEVAAAPQGTVEAQVDVSASATSTVTDAGEAVTTGGNPAPSSDQLLSSLSTIIDQLQSLITQLVGALNTPAGGDDY